MSALRQPPLIVGFLVFFLFVRRAHAFGAGNIAGISKVEGQNWRHGDIEDTLLKLLMARAVGGKKFDKLAVSRVYFGNWLRDYSQAIDVGTVKSVSAEAIRLLLSVLGFLTFGYGSREFEVTAYRLGCYRPEDHIDNPKNYADNLDARRYDPRLRGPVDERVELAIDPESGMKNYIANERANIMTSARHVRQLFGKCIDLGRNYRRSKRKEDLYEALRLMGTGLHCLEDFLAHSNYTELALIEMGERDVFPHVGRRTQIRLQGSNHPVYPIVTGTFGGVDFLHSVTGEVSDKMTQNEIQELEGTLQSSQTSDTSILQNLLDMIPNGIFGGGDKKQKMSEIQGNAAAAQMQQMSVSPRRPEEFTEYIKNTFSQIMPAIEFHDEILQSVHEAIEKIPILPDLISQLEDQLSIFVFSVIAPFVVPVINQIQNELQTGSSEIIQSSKAEQLIVFNDDNSTDPTHSMLSKDHFSNILNEIAGRIASKVVAWVVPQLMEAWDNDSVDIPRTLNRIIYGVLHHPAQRSLGQDGANDCREIMFRSVEEWWQNMSDYERDEYRRKLSREGVENGENHKEGVEDSGHGCGKPLSMQKNFSGLGSGGMGGGLAGAAAGAVLGGLTEEFADGVGGQSGGSGGFGGVLSELTGGGGGGGGGGSGGAYGLGGLLGAAGSLLGGGNEGNTETYVRKSHGADGSSSQTYTQYGRNDEGSRFSQAEFSRKEYPDGEERSDYRRYEQNQYGRGQETIGYGYEQRTERTERRSEGSDSYSRREEQRDEYSGGGGGYSRREEQREEYSGSGGGYSRREEQREEYSGSGGGYSRREEQREEEYSGSGGGYSRREEQREEYSGSGGGYSRREEQGEEYSGGGDEGWRGSGRRDDYGEKREEGYGERYEERDEERRDDNGGGFGNVLGGIVRQAEEAFEENEGRRRSGDGWGF